LTQRPEVVELTLSRLDEGKVASMIGDMLAIEPAPPSLGRILARESEGNPFFVCEYLRAAVETRLLGRTNGRWALTVSNAERLSTLESLPLPRTLRELVSQRLERVQGRTRALLEASAVMGRELEPELAADVGGVAESEQVAALAELVRQVVLEETSRGRFRFVHDKIREAAYAAIPTERRQLLHRRAAGAIEGAHRSNPGFEELYPMLAHHWLMAGELERAREYLDKAGEQALLKGAHADARELLTRSLTLDEQLDPRVRASPDQQARRQRMLGEACFGSGDLAGSVAHASAALVALGEVVPASRVGWLFLVSIELARQAAHRFVPRSTAARQRIDARGTEVARASGQLATSLYYRGEPLPALANVLRSTNRVETAGDLANHTLAYARLGTVMGHAGFRKFAEFYFGRARSLGKDLSDSHGLGIGLGLESIYRLDLTLWRQSEAASKQAIELLEEIGDLQEGEFARTMLGHALYHQGHIEEADKQFLAVLNTARARSNPHHVAWGLFLQGRSMLALGRAADALPLFEEAHSMLAPIFSRDHTAVMCEGPRALTYLAIGDASRTREIALALWQALQDRPPPPVGAIVDAYEGAASAFLGLWALEDATPRSRGASIAQNACSLLTRFARRFPLARPAALRCSGWLRWLSGRRASALRTWQRAANEARRRGMPYEQALAHEHLAFRATTEAERERHRSEVRKLFSQLGRAENSVTRWAHQEDGSSSTLETAHRREPLT
jgi:tetratricopeptide (TPR) repeat protein